MNNEQFNEFADILNTLLAQQTVLGFGVAELIRLLTPEQKAQFARSVKGLVGQVMQDRANESTPEMDAAMSLQLAALLESAGQPPQHG